MGLTRRNFLTVVGLGLGAGLLSACTTSSDSGTSTEDGGETEPELETGPGPEVDDNGELISEYTFAQNTDTANTYGFVDAETDKFEVYTEVAGTAGAYTSISSKIYKPLSGDTLIVTFHGNGEGGVDGICNNFAQIAANRLAVTFAADDVQTAFGGAYVLAFQAPDYWYNDYTSQAKDIIDQAVAEFGIDQVFVSGLSAGGLMTMRMLNAYGDFFSGALASCIAIAKNSQYVEGLGGTYEEDTAEFLDAGDEYTDGATFAKPTDYDDYLGNYDSWLESIAKSNVPIFLVHCYYDTTIFYQWSVRAYDQIKAYRDTNGLDGAIHLSLLDDVSYDDEVFGSYHWSWVKMLNGDAYADDDPGLDTITWFTSLSTSSNVYEPRVVENPTAGSTGTDHELAFNLIGTVTNSGEAITSIEIDMGGLTVDESELSADLFAVTGYTEDASGLISDEVIPFGLIGSEEEPVEVEVAAAIVNDAGNIVLELATQNAVLDYTSVLRNLETNVRYEIAPTTLPVTSA